MPVQSKLATFAAVTLTAALALNGCEKAPAPAPKPAPSHGNGAAKPPAPAPAPAKPDDHAHKPGDDHDHDHGHGPTTQLGEQTAGGFAIKASRDGDITPGGDAAIDVWITGGSAKVSAVRFWIGTQDAKGSVKARAELERDNYHTHVEVPKPLPDGSRLWVEIETDKGEKVLAGFDLKS